MKMNNTELKENKIKNTNKTILEVALEETDFSTEELKDILNPEKMT